MVEHPFFCFLMMRSWFESIRYVDIRRAAFLLVLPKPPVSRDDGGSWETTSRQGMAALSKMNCAMRCLVNIVVGFVELFLSSAKMCPL